VSARIDTVNVGTGRPNPDKTGLDTGIDKRPTSGPVSVRDPGPKQTGLGSGVVGDYIGDTANHGGSEQAVYAFAREDLDDWQQRLNRELPNGFFGENLTTVGIDLADARLGERWRIGDTVVVEVTCPRIPCVTFRGWVGEAGWLKTFTQEARPGAYLRVVVPGTIASGDRLEVIHRPEHDVSVQLTYRACTTARELQPRLLAAGDDLIDELREMVERHESFVF
jgi:MOSC domain-containing protein YiiM